MLDYMGFKLRVLLNALSLDWPAIEKPVEEAEHHWNKIEPRVADNGLGDAVRVVIAGMNKAAKSRNSEMAVFAAQIDLALVDLLERQFERIAKQKEFQLSRIEDKGWLRTFQLPRPSEDFSA